jgi:hypothetical protein
MPRPGRPAGYPRGPVSSRREGRLSFTVELTRGSEREVVDTIRYFDVPLGRVIAAAKVLVHTPPRSEGAPAPDGFLVLDEFGRPVASDADA